jgi:hypothetical protein
VGALTRVPPFSRAAQGRALLNAVGNMGLAGEYGAALKELGYTLEARATARRRSTWRHARARKPPRPP